MRIAICGLSAILLSGCSWLGGVNNVFGDRSAQAGQGAYGQYNQNGVAINNTRQFVDQNGRAIPAPYGYNTGVPGQQAQQYGQGFGGGFPQQPQYGAPQEVTGAYGTHAGNARQAQNSQRPQEQFRKPRLRGSLALGFEKSFSGDSIDFSQVAISDPAASYNPNDFAEGFVSGSPADGSVTSTLFTAVIEESRRPNISFDDVHSTPLSITGGLEYILTPKTTVFASAGYGYSEGEEGTVSTVIGELQQIVSEQAFDTETGAALGAPVTNVSFVPNQDIARFDYNFSDLRRLDLEVGARRYFDPIWTNSFSRSISPFVAASVGASRINEQTFTVDQRQVFFQQAFEGESNFFNVVSDGTPNVLSESQWIPRAQLNAGLEWQATPRTAIAFETGLKLEGTRDYAAEDAGDGDRNISVPFTIRGSYNF